MAIYLDNHATTRCDPRVVEAMTPYFSDIYGNAASRSHSFGMRANAGVERGRGQVASLLGASAKEIVFTSGATEANNLAILGVCRTVGRGHIITSTLEHKAVLDPIAKLEEDGFDVTRVGVDASGIMDADAVIAALRDDTILVSIMMANNEIGTVQPLALIGAACRERGIPLHTDASQAIGKIDIDVVRDHIDLLSLTAHKFYGPKGIGALFIRRGRPQLRLEPLQYGGGHERGYRSGTLPVPQCVALGAAAALCENELKSGELERVKALRDDLLDSLLAVGDVALNGSREHRLPNNINISIGGIDSKALMMNLRDIAMSSGSACSSENLKPSHVLTAIGTEKDRVHRSIRLGLGRFTTAEEVETAKARFADAIPKLRALSAGIPANAS
ncbi:MAG: cysteine desulfurase [Myxococcota bacterium]|jgi:cysteine desulfurase